MTDNQIRERLESIRIKRDWRRAMVWVLQKNDIPPDEIHRLMVRIETLQEQPR